MDRHDSLTEQLFLLAYDTGKGRLVSRSELGHALRAAVLADLLLAGHLTDERGKAAIGSPAPGTDPARDEILRQIREGRARSWQHWVARRRPAMVPAVRERLAAEGTITVDSRRVLGLFPVHRVTVRRPYAVKHLVEEVRRAVRGGTPVARVDTRLGVLAALAGTAELRTVLSWSERRRHKARLAELGGPVQPVVTGLRKAIQAARASAG